MTSPMTLGQLLAEYPTGYEKKLLDRYFETVYYKGEVDEQLASEMFQAFRCLNIIRFGDVVFTRERI